MMIRDRKLIRGMRKAIIPIIAGILKGVVGGIVKGAAKGVAAGAKGLKAAGKAGVLGKGVVKGQGQLSSSFRQSGLKLNQDKGFFGHMTVQGTKKDSSRWSKL